MLNIRKVDPMDDQQLVAAVLKGGTDKENSVKKLISDHQGYIFKLHIKTHVNLSILKDIYTDTVLVVIGRIENGTFKGESKLSTYLYQVFYFKTIDFIRKASAEKLVYVDNVPDDQASGDNIERNLEISDEARKLLDVINTMCSPCRQIILDWGYWGYSPEEIAARINENDPAKFSRIKYSCIEKLKKLWIDVSK